MDGVTKNILLKDLVDAQLWQKVQDNFSMIAGTSLRTLNADGSAVTMTSNLPRLCRDIINKCAGSCPSCGSCLPESLGGRNALEGDNTFTCLEGLLQHTLIPLRLPGGAIAGYVVFGPYFLVARKPREHFDAVAARCRYDAEMLWNEVLELRTFSYARVKGIVDLVTLVGEYIITLTSYAASSKQDIHKVMGNVMAQMDKFFESLLEVAAIVSGADCGSLMLLDGNKGELAVRYAFGTDRDMRLAGRVSVGSGISGRAFEKEETLLLDEKTADAALTKHMLRPMLASSMVIPYKVRGTTIGVLNLAAYRSNPVRFNASTVNSVNKLLELASFAFQVPIS